MQTRGFLSPCLLAFLGCGRALDPGTVQSTLDSGAGDFGVCAPQTVEGCMHAHFLLLCGMPGPGGETETCLSDNASMCPPDPISGQRTPCTSLCQTFEYALECNGSPPASCHLTVPTGFAQQFYCCSCSTGL
jgi:hypothetical protein